MEIKDVKDWKKEWREVEFNDTAILIGICRGRSAAHYKAYLEDHKAFATVFMKDFLDMVKANHVVGDKISGLFIIKKRGANFGIRLKDIETYKIPEKYLYSNIEVIEENQIPDYI